MHSQFDIILQPVLNVVLYSTVQMLKEIPYHLFL